MSGQRDDTAAVEQELATIIMQSMLASGGIDPNTHTVWTDWRPEAKAILAAGFGPVRAVEADLADRTGSLDMALQSARDRLARAESAEAALTALFAELTELADDFTENVDWSPGRSSYADNEAWETAGKRLRAVLARESR